MYLSGKTEQYFANPDAFGCMFSYRKTGGQDAALAQGCHWMLDNGAYTNQFDFRRWVAQLALLMPYRANCIGIIVPDVPYNAAATLARFQQYSAIPQALGFPVALASQNGMTAKDLPLESFDVLFVGGDNAHKRGREAVELAMAAKAHGKKIHVGRVSSVYSMTKFFSWADSWDGTTFVFGTQNERENKAEAMAAAILRLKKSKMIQWSLL